MLLEHHAVTKTNSKGKTNEDRFVLPLGALPQRLEAAKTEIEEREIQAKIDARTARGLIFAVLDGVGGAPLGMQAAQCGADALAELYKRPEVVPAARTILELLYAANAEIHAWGMIDDAEDPAGAGATGRPKGAACITAAYLSPANNFTIFQAGDTAAFVFRRRTDKIELYTGDVDTAGRSVRRYLGLGPALAIDSISIANLASDDMIVLVTDGVYPKGFANRDLIRAILVESGGDPETAATMLVDRARSRGSVDDITAIAMTVG